ncbi:WYL domain-containing protein [Rhodobacter sp. KR11]|uniref:helix-turn-helix transcriptional regulator n=1 Tax=Rhodobacter sp. KR11 TaxID=2974588 RepID=UPI002222FCA7|nr:WYL domain-containing protein [Rhodobacter sp. KR11]MCW1919912.1 WYL domain-containing protein [Rhodobacter sp. KR11]
MSFQKATDLLRLAEMASARHAGVSLTEIEETFGVDRRTAQRMTKALEETFPNCITRTDDDRRKFWKLRADHARLMLAQGIRDSELIALNLAIQRAEREGAVTDVRALAGLRDRLLASMPGPHARRAEADAEAVLEAHGFASRPGPAVRVAPDLLGLISEALKGPHVISLTYSGRPRRLEPHGLLLGTRRYLVAREVGESRMQHYRLDRIEGARLEATSFARDPGFDLATHAARAFGSYYAEDEYGEVVWRFTPKAAVTARDFLFHPTQEMTDEADGSLTLRFTASGWLEMVWHLYLWGDQVQVLAPEALAQRVADHRRTDFVALP